MNSNRFIQFQNDFHLLNNYATGIVKLNGEMIHNNEQIIISDINFNRP